MIENMFDRQLHDHWDPPDTTASRLLVGYLVAAARQENQAAARRLRAVAELFEMRREERGEAEDWAVDTWAAVSAEVAAALCISLGKAGSCLHYGLAMHRLPRVAAAFEAGDIDLNTYRTIVYRTELVTDADAMAEVDRLLSARLPRWPSMTQGRLMREIDRVVAGLDPDAVRRTRDQIRNRTITIWHDNNGLAEISGRLLDTDAHALDKRLDSLAATVCTADPRSIAERRADAMGALAAGADRLMCRCGTPECPATAATPSPVVIHVVAEQGSLEGQSDTPGYLLGADVLIPPELLRDLAVSARLRPLTEPQHCVAEPQYHPSRTLADFVRARDLTCRAPGCDRPATECDLDHTIPYPRGATHPSNIKALCRFHHILKTFLGWQDRQLEDGTVIWTLPGGETYVTIPGSALLFPSLMAPTGEFPLGPEAAPSGDRAAMAPKRKTRRSANRAHRIACERNKNHRARLGAGVAAEPAALPGDDPPPF